MTYYTPAFLFIINLVISQCLYGAECIIGHAYKYETRESEKSSTFLVIGKEMVKDKKVIFISVSNLSIQKNNGNVQSEIDILAITENSYNISNPVDLGDDRRAPINDSAVKNWIEMSKNNSIGPWDFSIKDIVTTHEMLFNIKK
jgi:hypothetical protein